MSFVLPVTLRVWYWRFVDKKEMRTFKMDSYLILKYEKHNENNKEENNISFVDGCVDTD